MVGEAHAHVQGASLKACAAFLVKLLNSPITRGHEALRQLLILVVLVVGLDGCHRRASQRGAQEHSASKAESFLNDSSIGETTENFERSNGAPVSIKGAIRDYQSHGCRVQTFNLNGQIERVRVNLEPRCSYLPADFPQISSIISSNLLDLGILRRAVGGMNYASNCFSDCAPVPTAMYAELEGAGSHIAVDYVFEAAGQTENYQRSVMNWMRDISSDGSHMIENNQGVSCEAFTKVGEKDLADLKVTAITFGRHISRQWEPCSEYQKAQASGPSTEVLRVNVTGASAGDAGSPAQRQYGRDEFRHLVIGKSAAGIISLLGRPLSVNDGIEPGSQIYDYSSNETFLGSVPFRVVDQATGLTLQSVTLVIGSDGRTESVQF